MNGGEETKKAPKIKAISGGLPSHQRGCETVDVRSIVIRRPYQGKLFGGEEASVKSMVMASNRKESADEVVKWYNRQI